MSEVEELKNRLFYKRENAWEDKTGEQLNNILHMQKDISIF